MAYIEYYNCRRYYKRPGYVTPYNVCTGKQQEIIQRRREVKSRALEVISDKNRTTREYGKGL
jgi:hypothetical protein